MEIQALLITFREVLEALLIVGIITTYLKRTNNQKFTKYVWLGAGLAVLASVGVAMLFQVVFTGFTAMGSEMYLKIGIMVVSTVLLTQMVFWMASHSRNLKGNMEGKMNQFITAGNIVGMVIHSFLVVLREGVETVFFFAAITGGNIGAAMQGWGAITGAVIAATISYFFFKGTMRIPLKSFFKVTGAFIILISAGLLVQAISMMQDINLIGSVVPHLYDITWLLPEHPIDYAHYLRDHGVAPLLSGDVGIFLKALFGYSSMPSIEEVVAYIGYFAAIYLLTSSKTNKEKAVKSAETVTKMNVLNPQAK
ncbi:MULTISPECIES: FTR1 family protein [unclassified Bacillus (in: firmicutes)]|uniref:FTR1 family iron permease n=1 Tax=unclassified Bacillus (in: firmicutes) TaxID=185979 RepID=UPI0008E6638A|nr:MULTISPECIES: FTR1 family protein [unclassified Bacillus (in: firmicutes)]SFB16837.1 high-affinity iron transporter [Bacillus sp. UNCCL13]SFQ77822.1 high-affinity iron transporter [Bacillus sp. cl95]